MSGNAPQRVLVVGINYAPEHAGIAPYTTAAAQYLASVGHHVVVLTGVPHYPSWTLPGHYRWRLRSRELVEGVELVRLRHFVPRFQTAARRAWYELSFALQVLLSGGGRSPDFVVAVVPSLLSSMVAGYLARRRGARFVVWVQDSMSAAAVQSGMPGGSRVSTIVRGLEERLLRQADLVAVAAESFRSRIEEAGVDPARIVELPNWVHVERPVENVPSVREQLGWKPEEVIVLHSGNMGLKQDLAIVVEAARLASHRGLQFRFVLMGDGSQRQHLEALSRDVPALTIVDPVADDCYASVLAAADILLVNERRGVLDMSLPSKLTSYFACGRPVVAAVDPAGGTAQEIRRSSAGLVAEQQTAEGLVAAVLSLAEDTEWREQLGAAGARYAETHLSAAACLDRLASILGADAGTAVDKPMASTS